MKIATWNVTTLKHDYRIGVLTDEFIGFELDLLGVSETHILGAGSMKLCDIEFVYSGRKIIFSYGSKLVASSKLAYYNNY